jgi:hypothetical protein
MELYDALIAAGCEIDSHESDLYVKATLVAESGRLRSFFTHQVTGETWIDVPFAYLPWWEKRAR